MKITLLKSKTHGVLTVGKPGKTVDVLLGDTFEVENEAEVNDYVEKGRAEVVRVYEEGEVIEADSLNEDDDTMEDVSEDENQDVSENDDAENTANMDQEGSNDNNESGEVAESGEQVSNNDAESTDESNESVDASEGEGEEAVETAESLTALTKDALKALINERGLTFEGNPKKAELVKILLEANTTAEASGE